MRHKPLPPSSEGGLTSSAAAASSSNASGKGKAGQSAPLPQLKLSLASGVMVLMRGRTQANWLHSIPKRKDPGVGHKGRINITFRKALVRGGTENYYRYNVGGENAPVFRWHDGAKEMRIWDKAAAEKR